MTSWSKRAFAPGHVLEWAAVQDAFEKQYMATFPLHWSPEHRANMMLVMEAGEDGSDVLYMALPDGARPFHGFNAIKLEEIPPSPTLLVGDQIGYEQVFQR